MTSGLWSWKSSLRYMSRDMTKPPKWVCTSEDSDQPGHPPSLIRVFAVRTKKAWVLSYPLSAQRRLWSDWADAQAYLSLRWAHSHFVGLSCRGSYTLTFCVLGLFIHYSIIIISLMGSWRNSQSYCQFFFFFFFLKCEWINDLCHVKSKP